MEKHISPDGFVVHTNCIYNYVLISFLLQPENQPELTHKQMTDGYPRFNSIDNIELSAGDENKLMVTGHLIFYIICELCFPLKSLFVTFP